MDKIVKSNQIGPISFLSSVDDVEPKRYSLRVSPGVDKISIDRSISPSRSNGSKEKTSTSSEEDTIPSKWIFESPTTYTTAENLLELIHNEEGFESLIRYCERSYW